MSEDTQNSPKCRRSRLASSARVTVEICTCGQMHLHVGPVSLRFKPGAVRELAQTLRVAMAAFDRQQPQPKPVPIVPGPSEES